MEQAPAAESFAGSSLYATREVDTQPEEVDPQLGEADPHSGGAYPQSLAQSPSSGSSSPTKSPYASVPESRRPSKSRASRAHFLELVTRGKLRVADELVVQLRRQIQTHGQTVSVDDVGVFTVSSHLNWNLHPDSMLTLLASSSAEPRATTGADSQTGCSA